MFSFFKTKKHSPEHSASEAIPGPIPPAPKDDDFIFIERKSGSSPASSAAGTPSHGGMYPGLPQMPSPSAATRTAPAAPLRQESEDKPSHILHGVPFKLSPELAKDNNAEITQYQVNEILAFISRTTAAGARADYDFSLERSVLSEG